MNESEALQVLLLRVFEDPVAAPWSEADRDAMSREAERALGEAASPERLIATRAALAMTCLLDREPRLRAAHAAAARPAWLVPTVLLLAFGVGLAIDSLGSANRINLFAVPLLAMLAWNLVVYALLAGRALGGHGEAWRPPAPLHALVSRIAHIPRSSPPALSRFIAEWARASAPLQTLRLTAMLHAAAAVLAIGALASMYARGSFFEFRAGWDSTFFEAATLHRLVTWMLGPASLVSGITLPTAAEFATLRLSAGQGEVAARWIHLYALTIVGVIVLPRLLLAARAGWRARRIARAFPLPLQESYFQRLLTRQRGVPVAVQVLPYSYHLPPGRSAALRAVLAPDCAGEPDLRLADSVPLGGEDDPERWLGAARCAAGGLVVALFPLTATPERETHGAFVTALAARLPAGGKLLVLVDEASFRQRFGTDASGRLEQRREAWRGLMRQLGHEPRFADLSLPAPER